MGMEQFVRFPAEPPAWTAARVALGTCAPAFQVCMIDGELAFPDEQPPEPWRELRLRTEHGMITVRREANRLAFAIWGNADASLREHWQKLAQAFADAGAGVLEPFDV